MQILQAIQSYASQPISHQLLLSLLNGYKRPNDKIHELIKKGDLQALKRGLYTVGPSISLIQPETFLIANHLLGPSYVSLDSALSYHGLIPERVFEISSVTVKQSRSFSNATGVYHYIHLPLPYYSFGIINVQFDSNQSVMLASAEKALFDKVITSKGVVFRSLTQAHQYLLENLRLDVEGLKKLKLEEMRLWLNNAPKKESLFYVLKLIESL
jgi:predicted transcriptional regulator of viral defense system